jgi:hypothetical protein
MKKLVSCILILLSLFCYSQEISFGDTAMIREIKKKCSLIYETKDSTIFLLTKSNFHQNAASGTNIIIDSYQGKITRIVAYTTTVKGLSEVEYYYWDSQLIMIYKTMEYYEEESPIGQNKNFRNIPYWESRFYIDKDELVAHKHSGRKGIGIAYKAKTESAHSKKIFEFVKRKTSLR